MTVGELIGALSQFHPHTPVVVSGFDGWGFDGLSSMETVTLKRCTSGSCVAPDFDAPNERDTAGEEINALALL